jgi:hypothetical protein
MKNNKWMIPLLGAMMQQELLSLDKVIGRIYAHMDRLTQ